MKINYLLENIFLVQQKKVKIDNDGKISDGHISIEDYLMCEKIWNKPEMKNIGDYHDHYLKKDALLLADVFEKFITYLEKDNLYGWSMSEYLPYEKFEWLKNIDEFDVMSINEKSDKGYILEVDL